MKALDIIVGFITAFLVSAGGVLIGVYSSGYQPNKNTFVAAIIVGLTVAGKDLRSTMKLPPLSNGNLEALKQLYASQPQPIETKQP